MLHFDLVMYNVAPLSRGKKILLFDGNDFKLHFTATNYIQLLVEQKLQFPIQQLTQNHQIYSQKNSSQ